MGAPVKRFYIKPHATNYNRNYSAEAVDEESGWFDGRARRSEFWSRLIITQLITWLIAFPLVLVPILIAMANRESGDGAVASIGAILCVISGAVLALICGLVMWPVTVRRFHDRGMSGWWILWFYLLGLIFFGIPYVVKFVILGFMDGEPGPNQYGPDPKGRKRYGTQGVDRPVVHVVNNNSNINTPSSSVKARLARLEELRASGVISEPEYAKKRAQILSEL